jgi:DNA-binding response OmpR family regulator
VVTEQGSGPDEGHRVDRPTPPDKPGARPLRVLVVDDEPAVADTLALILGMRGYDVRTAYDGSVAVWAAEEFRPHAVLLDLAMPNLHGYEVARRLRRQAGLRDALLVAVTGHADPFSRPRAAGAGFDHYLVKPVGWPELEPLLTPLPGGPPA